MYVKCYVAFTTCSKTWSIALKIWTSCSARAIVLVTTCTGDKDDDEDEGWRQDEGGEVELDVDDNDDDVNGMHTAAAWAMDLLK